MHIPQAGHDPSTGLRAGLRPQVYEPLRGVDLIMHAGDLLVPDVIDWLERLAPVEAVWGNGDFGGWQRTVPPQAPRLREAWILSVDALRIGLVHDMIRTMISGSDMRATPRAPGCRRARAPTP